MLFILKIITIVLTAMVVVANSSSTGAIKTSTTTSTAQFSTTKSTIQTSKANPTTQTSKASPTAISTTQTSKANPTTQTSKANPTTQTSKANPTTQTSKASPTAISTTQTSTTNPTTQASATMSPTQSSTVTTQSSIAETTAPSSSVESTTRPNQTDAMSNTTASAISTTTFKGMSFNPQGGTTSYSISTDARRPVSDACDMIPVAVIVSFISGMLVVILVWLILKARKDRRWCFKETEEPVRAKWEGASDKITTKVIRQHTLERLNQIDILAKEEISLKDIPTSAADKTFIVNEEDKANDDDTVGDGNETTEKHAKTEGESEDKDEKDNAVGETEAAEPKTNQETTAEEELNDNSADSKDEGTGSNEGPCKQVSEDSEHSAAEAESRVKFNVEDEAKICNFNETSLQTEKGQTLFDEIQIFEMDRGSTASALRVSDSQDFFTLENENFRNSKVSING